MYIYIYIIYWPVCQPGESRPREAQPQDSSTYIHTYLCIYRIYIYIYAHNIIYTHICTYHTPRTSQLLGLGQNLQLSGVRAGSARNAYLCCVRGAMWMCVEQSGQYFQGQGKNTTPVGFPRAQTPTAHKTIALPTDLRDPLLPQRR